MPYNSEPQLRGKRADSVVLVFEPQGRNGVFLTMGFTTRLRDLSLAQLVLCPLAAVSASRGEPDQGLAVFPRKNLTQEHGPGRGNHSDWDDGPHKEGREPPWDTPRQKGGNAGKPKAEEHYTLAQHYHAHNILDQFKFMTVDRDRLMIRPRFELISRPGRRLSKARWCQRPDQRVCKLRRQEDGAAGRVCQDRRRSAVHRRRLGKGGRPR